MDPKHLRIEAGECVKAIWDRIRQGEELPEMDDQLSRLTQDIHTFVPKHTSEIKDSFFTNRRAEVEFALQQLEAAATFVDIARALIVCAEEGSSPLVVYVAAREIVRKSPLTEELPGKIKEAEYKSWGVKR